MKLKFDAGLEYQLDAINAVVDLFEGLPPKQGEYEVSIAPAEGAIQFSELGTGNRLDLDEDGLLRNLHKVQERNTVPKSRFLRSDDDEYPFPNFSVQMETGTGKTYVYLRTIFELNRKYGFRKFVIVVPSVAIREGVLSSIRLMQDHLRGLYDNIPFDHFVYNSKDLSKVRQFAVSNEIQIMVINIQAFQKEADETIGRSGNIIHQEQDRMSGRRPIEYVQAARPIVVIDEPQSVDNTPKAKRAIQTLNPLFCLRYSATHSNPYNLLYDLDPIKAYDMRLVKRIEVCSIRAEGELSEAFIRLDSVGYAKGVKTPHGKVTILKDTKSGPKEKKITLRQGMDLSAQTDRAGYDGYIVNNICAEEGLEHVAFTNGKTLRMNEEEGGTHEEELKAQIRHTVEEHFKKELRFKDKGIKVLSLFFVDKVANYRYYDDDGQRHKGKLAQWFEEAYKGFVSADTYKGLLPYSVDDVHDGYFSVDKKGILKDTRGQSKADEDTYDLIMRDKERLLSPEEPVRFIFSHSALREGWDNPNVFQICTLREMSTERERRQTLGRGLRLPVHQRGGRIYNDDINRLTVVANESFEDYVRGLQQEIEEDIGGGFKYGRLKKTAFSQLIDGATDQTIGQEESERIWSTLVNEGYLDKHGDLTEKFVPEKPGFVLEVPEDLEPMRCAILDEMKRHIFKNRVVNTSDRKRLKYNKRVELNEGFKALWKRINVKTRYSVEFKTKDLIASAAKKILGMKRINPVRIVSDKTEVEQSLAGVEGGKVLDVRTEDIEAHRSLPDLLAFLQRETELTRGTLVEILKRSNRLGEFTVNPQAFMTETALLINRALHELVVKGIKYERLENQVYEMRLFEEQEIEEYLARLYEVQSTDNRTPYDWIPLDSEVEREIATKLDQNENVRFFCKLPKWFKIPTPLGSYNPDWAIATERDQKLYLVRETKSTHDRDKRRSIENQKVECGRAHFSSLGVDYEVATDIHEVLTEHTATA